MRRAHSGNRRATRPSMSLVSCEGWRARTSTEAAWWCCRRRLMGDPDRSKSCSDRATTRSPSRLTAEGPWSPAAEISSVVVARGFCSGLTTSRSRTIPKIPDLSPKALSTAAAAPWQPGRGVALQRVRPAPSSVAGRGRARRRCRVRHRAEPRFAVVRRGLADRPRRERWHRPLRFLRGRRLRVEWR